MMAVHRDDLSKQKVIFRHCRSEDLPQVQVLVNDLYDADSNVKGLRPAISLSFSEFEKHPDKGRLIVLEQAEAVVGYCIIVFFWSNEYGGNIIDIDELNLAAHVRGKGLGSALFAWLADEFAHALVGFSLQVSHENHRARRFYERLGFSESRNQHLIYPFLHGN